MIRLSAKTADDVIGKLDIMLDDDELRESAGATSDQIEDLIASIPRRGGDWDIPAWSIPLVLDEVENMRDIWEQEADVEYDRAAVLGGIRRLNHLMKQLKGLAP